MQGSVAWITIAPVKSLALVHRDEVELEPFGVRENRRFYLVDDNGRMINGKVVGPLVRVVPDYDDAVGQPCPAPAGRRRRRGRRRGGRAR